MLFDDVYASILARSSVKGVGLAGMRVLLRRLGNPHQKFKVIHVAGTNGKGTVCTLLAHAITTAGFSAGLFISPHLISPTERISIDGESISKQAFSRVIRKVLSVEDSPLNFFEILTLAAFVYFAQKKVQYVVLETGLGGRKDPTNVCMPLICLITSVGLDHTAILGKTIEKIAWEKAGIIKKGIPLFCGMLPPVAQQVVCEEARRQQVPLFMLKKNLQVVSVNWKHKEMSFWNGKARWALHLLGEKQLQNAYLVYCVCRFLNIPSLAIKKAFKTVNMPGRFEIITTKNQIFILDGAHNPPAIKNLISFFQRSPFYGKAALLCGFMKDKAYAEMLSLLAPHFSQIIVTCPPSLRAALPEEYPITSLQKKIHFIPNVEQAFHQASSHKIILCTGSFYLVGWMRKKLHEDKKIVAK